MQCLYGIERRSGIQENPERRAVAARVVRSFDKFLTRSTRKTNATAPSAQRTFAAVGGAVDRIAPPVRNSVKLGSEIKVDLWTGGRWLAGRDYVIAQTRARAAGQLILLLLLVFMAAFPLAARDKDKLHYGEGLIVNIPAPESEVEQVVEDITQNGVIRGTKQYNKDEFVAGAKAATSSRVFPPWDGGGKVFYKIREQTLDPRNFKDSSDVGTLAVRYVVQPQGDKNAVLRIDALFKEDFRQIVHQSDGSVESAEYKDIHEHIEAIEVMKQQNLEADRERQEQLEKKRNPALQADSTSSESAPLQSSPVPSSVQSAPVQSEPQAAPQAMQNESVPTAEVGATAPPGQSLEEHVKQLRSQVERRVKSPGAPLKSAPFHTASNLQSLDTGTEVLILVSTPYWYGVETHDGQHGWIMRDELEQP
jgi:hypothetical protein